MKDFRFFSVACAWAEILAREDYSGIRNVEFRS